MKETSNNGCNIDNDSKLRNARNLTNLNEINQLYARPYMSVPYAGRGIIMYVMKVIIKVVKVLHIIDLVIIIAGIYIDRFVPQLNCIKTTVQNPKHLIPRLMKLKRIRGGQPSETNYKK